MKRKGQLPKVLLGLIWALAAYSWSPAQRLSAGTYHSLFICADSSVMAWGQNSSRQLGNGTTVDCKTPTNVSGLSDVIAVAAGDKHSLALKSDGTVWAWGANNLGQLGIGGTGLETGIVQVNLSSNVIAIATRWDHSLALLSDSTVWAWGANGSGQIGNGNTSPSVPTPVPVLDSVIAIATGENHSLAVRWDSTVWAWGNNQQGQLGNGFNLDESLPVKTSNISGVIAVAGGALHSMALKANGEVWTWGNDAFEQLGNGTNGQSNVPIPAIGLPSINQIDAGQRHSAAVDGSGNLWVWGESSQGRLGLGTVPDQHTPVPIPNISGITEVRGGSSHTLAFASGNTAWCFGDNEYGQLGDGSTGQRDFPTNVIGLCPPIEATVAADYNTAFSPTTSGTNKWIAGEIASSILLPNDKTLWIFGNSQVDSISPGGTIPCSTHQVDNCLVIQDNAQLNNLNTLLDTTSGTSNRSYFQLTSTDSTFLRPGHGYINGDSLYIFLSRYDSSQTFLGTYSARIGIGTMDLEDIGRALPPTAIDWGKAVIVDSIGGFIYVYGSKVDSIRKPYVARRSYANTLANWEYYDGSAWSLNTLDAVPVSQYEVDERFSVHKLQGRYYMVTQDEFPDSALCGVQRNILVYRSDSLTGPFGQPGWIYTNHTIYGAQPLLAFDAYAHPKAEHCDTLLVSYDIREQEGGTSLDSCRSQCSLGSSQSADSWRPKFIRVPFTLLDSNLSHETTASFTITQVGNTWIFTNTSTLAYQFTWDFGDSSLPQTGVNATHIFTSGGTFMVTLIAGGCGTPDTLTEPILMTGEAGSAPRVWLFPNPSNGQVQLRAQYLSNRPVTIEVLNPMGQSILHRVEHPIQGSLDLHMEMNLGKGVYLVRVTNGTRATVMRLCIL